MTRLAVTLSVLLVRPLAAAAEELPRMTRLADGVYAYEQIDPTNRGVTVNNLIVVTTDGVLVADAENLEGALKRAYMEIDGQLPAARQRHENAVIDLWMEGKPAFGVYAPNENPGPRGQGPRPFLYTREGGEKLAANPLYDYVFLNLEGAFDLGAVKAIAEGLRSPGAAGRKTLIVRIPPIERDGAVATKARVKEALDAGADGVTIPHVRSVEEARAAISFFRDAGANVWSPANPRGEKLAMLMLEDPDAVRQARGRVARGLQHSGLRHRQPDAGARRRPGGGGSGHAARSGRSEACGSAGHAHRQSTGRREAGQGGLPRAPDAGAVG